ncbi:MAG: O-antigen ligase family protein [Verrucomicrobiales bacterium]|nr:O-antigen ligase family protein [Verrucomicrobiales bacterium]
MRKQHSELPGPGWLIVLAPLVALIFYAPLAFGGTTPSSVEVIDSLLASSFVLWLGLLIFEKRRPRIPLTCLSSLVFLSIFGLAHALNPGSYFEPDSWRFILLVENYRWLPGTVDTETTAPIIRHLGALSLAFLVLVDACAHSRTRWFLIYAVALAGLLIAGIGIYQRASGADSMLWVTPDRSGKLFFGAFRYNANAAAFLNLSWPATLAIWLRSRALDPSGTRTSAEFCALFLLFIAVFVNTSKAGQILGLIAALISVIWFWKLVRPKETSASAIAIMSALFLSLFLIALLPALNLITERWEATSQSLAGRMLVYEASSKILPNSGWFGTGPGTFRLIFPFYTGYLGDRLSGTYTHTHQDYLQTLIEWGYLGFAGWLVLIGGGLWVGLTYAFRMKQKGRNDLTTSCSLIALSTILLHALVDFPLQIPSVQILAAFYLAICWSASQRDQRKVRLPKRQ